MFGSNAGSVRSHIPEEVAEMQPVARFLDLVSKMNPSRPGADHSW